MTQPSIAIGADHGGFDDKKKLTAHLKQMGYRVMDVGTTSADAADYPIFGFRVAEAVQRGQVDLGVLLCRTGNGMAMAANQVPQVRAAIATNSKLAVLAREHNEANVIVLASDFLQEPGEKVLDAFLGAKPEDGRHARRVGMIKEYSSCVSSGLATHRLLALGQSPWLDDISDTLIASGKLQRLVEHGGVRGVTSNPSIFEKAINSGEGRYPGELAELKKSGASAIEAYEQLTMGDIRAAADTLRPVFDQTGGDDGFVSLEVLPSLATEEDKTVEDARRLFSEVDRPNLMIKVPGTPEGIRAFRRLTAEGININVTLIFSRAGYNEIARAYIAGLSDRVKAGEDPTHVRSVASVFVSRIDTSVDKRLSDMREGETDAKKIELIDSLTHKTAIDNTRLIYSDFKSIFHGDEFAELAELGAAAQRPLWGSTSMKNPDLPDTMYVEDLVGAQTVNTIPGATLEALLDHGQVRGATLERDLEGAAARLEQLQGLGIDVEQVCDELQVAGVKSFADAFDTLFDAITKALA